MGEPTAAPGVAVRRFATIVDPDPPPLARALLSPADRPSVFAMAAGTVATVAVERAGGSISADDAPEGATG